MASSTGPRYTSSTSMAASGLVRSAARAVTIPSGMFAPVEFVATAPPADRAAAASAVAVLLPFVPVTSTDRRPAETVASTPG